MAVTSLRFATACGMSDRLRLDLVLNDFVACAIASGEITVLSDGTPWRPLIDVEDMARAISWAIVRKPENGGKFLAVNAGRDESNYQVQRTGRGGRAPGAGNQGLDQHQRAARTSAPTRWTSALFKSLAPAHIPQVTLDESIRRLREGLDRHGLRRQGLPQLALHAAEDARASHGGRPARPGSALASPAPQGA